MTGEMEKEGKEDKRTKGREGAEIGKAYKEGWRGGGEERKDKETRKKRQKK